MEISEKLYIGDVVEMRKVHPCGGRDWKIDRIGADIGLVCQTCGRRVLLSRRKLARGAKRFIARGAEFSDQAPAADASPGIPFETDPKKGTNAS